MESEQPKISRSKLDGLRRFYGMDSNDGTVYFRVHEEADVRHAAVWKDTRPGDTVLDAGCGPGVMSELALQLVRNLRITLLDPLDVMLDVAKSRVKSPSCMFTKGYFEDMVFPDGSFDVVMCGFSLRDARNLDRALSEIKRVLKPGGKLLLVDLGKPDNPVTRWLTGGYWRILVPLVAIARLGRTGLLYSALYKTYKRHPTNRQLLAKLYTYFADAKLISRMGGGAVIITCSKQNHP